MKRPCFGIHWLSLLSAIVLLEGIGHCAEPVSLLPQVGQAITAGTDFLVAQQHEDGTWRSKTYGLLKDGTSLTPLVLASLPQSSTTQAARDLGRKTLSSWIDVRSGQIRVMPQYPVYSAGLALKLIHDKRATEHDKPWKELLIAHQLTDANGWTESDARFGGWGYSHDPPQKPAAGVPLSPLDEPNLSATVFALEALTLGKSDEQITTLSNKALLFVQRCQNWRENAPAADAKFNDGGFHFILDDNVRNKPGVAGTDSTGQTRFHSYGSTTADGLRALLACGLKPDHPRVIAARRWLVDHFHDGAHPGAYPDDRSHLRPSLDYYYAASLAQALRRLRTNETAQINPRCAVILASRLVALQRQDGSWMNRAVDVREDDPLIATSFALQALQWCRDELK